MCDLIKSKDRVRDHGEVFTPQFIVNRMLNLSGLNDAIIDPTLTTLEPTCGEGVFLMEVLRRNLVVLKTNYCHSQKDYEFNAMIAISKLYGFDIQADNVKICRANLLSVFKTEYKNLFTNRNKDFIKSISHILSKNIMVGDTLELANTRGGGIPTVPEWIFKGYTVTRENFFYCDIVQATDLLPADRCNKKPYPVSNYRQLWKNNNV